MDKNKDSCYLILLGGTGAKCGELIVHMCANGYLDCKRLNILYIDSDSENGNSEQLKNVITSYEKCRKQYCIEESPIPFFFKTEIDYEKVTPVDGYTYFNELTKPYGQDAVGVNSAEIFMKALYSEEEQNMKISNGFFAHPNVGSAFFAANIDTIMKRFYGLINSDHQEMKNIKVFMIGSIFGGTGASAFPIISKFLKEKLVVASDNENINEFVKIGGCMMLPYFSFSRDNVRKQIAKGKKIDVEADKFVTKTRSALEYYKYIDENQDSDIFDSLYILGHDGYDVRGIYNLAGKGQNNMPHITEFYAAMSAVDFFETPMDHHGRFFGVIPSKKINWTNIYKYPKGFFNFFIMMRFAIVMKSLILEELFDYTKNHKLKKNAQDIPWFYDFLNGREKSTNMDEGRLYEKFDAISQYCDQYIRWFAELNISNLKKRNDLGSIIYEGGEDESDVVEYLQLFDKQILIKQHFNNCIVQGDVKDGDSKVYENIYRQNVEYIRKHFEELEDECNHNDIIKENIKMENIWSRICDLGFNNTAKLNNILQNLTTSSDKSMEAGVKNLINAIFIACMI